MKRLFTVMLGVMVVSLAIIACKDDFNEQDFLQLQHNLKLEQDSVRRARNKAAVDSSTKEVVQSYIDAQNQAGSLMAVTIIVREDNTPLAGVLVSISSGTAKTASGGRSQASVSATTDATGVVVFDNAVIANSSITLSKTGYVSASALLEFGSPGAPVPIIVPDPVTGGTKTIYVSPQKEYHNVSLPMFSESATGSTSVITGIFSIENDMTNDPALRDPIPANTVIAADVSQALDDAEIITGTVPVTDYRFTGAAGSLGVAAVDPVTGSFTMRVPATAQGMGVDIILPKINGTSRMAIRRLNGGDVTPTFMNVPTVWEPGNSSAITVLTNNIPQIPGAVAVINTGTPPPAPGRGFSAAFATISRSLETGFISPPTNSTRDELGNTAYSLTLRGRGFSSSPAVAITAGGGSGATATSSLRGFITSASVSATGSGYTASTAFDIQFTYTNSSAGIVPIAKIDVTTNAAGEIPLQNFNFGSLIDPGFPASGDPFETTQGMQGFGVRVVNNGTNTPATATVQATIPFTFDTEVYEVQVVNGGSGYISAPTFAFTGGGTPTTQAAMSVIDFKTRYTITLGGTTTTPYRLVPEDFVFTFASTAIESGVIEDPARVDRLSSNLSAVSTNVPFIGQVITDGTNLSALDPLYTFRTTRFWTTAPTLSIQDQVVTKAAANLDIGTDGVIIGIINPNGDSPSINDLFPTAGSTQAGQGYNAFSMVILPSMTGAPGSGGELLPNTTLNLATKEINWDGTAVLVSGGSGYMRNLNRATTNVPYSGPGSVFVQTGQTIAIVVNAGHGIRLVNVSNN